MYHNTDTVTTCVYYSIHLEMLLHNIDVAFPCGDFNLYYICGFALFAFPSCLFGPCYLD